MNDFYEYNYLCHHGILGMKWGVRRYQNKDGSLTSLGRKHYKKENSNDYILKKGTIFHRVAGTSNSGYTKGVYATYRIDDRSLYKGVLGRMRLNPKSSVTKGDFQLYDVKLTAGKDIRIPSKESRMELFESFTNNKRNRKDVEKIIAKQSKLKNFSFDKVKNEKDMEKAYQYFNEAFGRGTGHGNKVVSRFYEHAQKKGYDAIVDENDVRLSTFKAKAPIIFFDTKLSISKTSSTKLTPGDIIESFKDSHTDKVKRDILYRKGHGVEDVIEQNKKETTRYDKYVKERNSKYSKNYTLNDLSEDWYSYRFTTKQIQKINRVMIENQTTRLDAIEKLGYKKNVVADFVMTKINM